MSSKYVNYYNICLQNLVEMLSKSYQVHLNIIDKKYKSSKRDYLITFRNDLKTKAKLLKEDKMKFYNLTVSESLSSKEKTTLEKLMYTTYYNYIKVLNSGLQESKIVDKIPRSHDIYCTALIEVYREIFQFAKLMIGTVQDRRQIADIIRKETKKALRNTIPIQIMRLEIKNSPMTSKEITEPESEKEKNVEILTDATGPGENVIDEDIEEENDIANLNDIGDENITPVFNSPAPEIKVIGENKIGSNRNQNKIFEMMENKNKKVEGDKVNDEEKEDENENVEGEEGDEVEDERDENDEVEGEGDGNDEVEGEGDDEVKEEGDGNDEVEVEEEGDDEVEEEGDDEVEEEGDDEVKGEGDDEVEGEGDDEVEVEGEGDDEVEGDETISELFGGVNIFDDDSHKFKKQPTEEIILLTDTKKPNTTDINIEKNSNSLVNEKKIQNQNTTTNINIEKNSNSLVNEKKIQNQNTTTNINIEKNSNSNLLVNEKKIQEKSNHNKNDKKINDIKQIISDKKKKNMENESVIYNPKEKEYVDIDNI